MTSPLVWRSRLPGLLLVCAIGVTLLFSTGCVVYPNGQVGVAPIVVEPAGPPVVSVGYYGTPAGYYYGGNPVYIYNGRSCYYSGGRRYWYGGGGYYGGGTRYYGGGGYYRGGRAYYRGGYYRGGGRYYGGGYHRYYR